MHRFTGLRPFARWTAPARPPLPLLAASAIAAALVALESAAAQPASPAPFTDRLWRFLGVLHPLVVHFPIALLTVAAIAAVVRRFIWRGMSGQIITFCLTFGALGAAAAAMMGWARADGRTEEVWGTLFIHRWLGVCVAAIAVAIWLWAVVGARRWVEAGPARSFVFALAGLGALVGFTGHLGGELVYPGMINRAVAELVSPSSPIDYSQEMSEPPAPTEPSGPTGGGPSLAAGPVPPVASASIDFTTQVWPILRDKCIQCHGPEKQKGDLRLDSQEAAIHRGDTKIPAYEPGNSAESEMIALITAEREDERMPPVGEGEPVTIEELRVLRRWIDAGAVWGEMPPAP